jgi:hypothetical protein
MAFNSLSKESLALVCLVQDGGRWLQEQGAQCKSRLLILAFFNFLEWPLYLLGGIYLKCPS